MAGKVEWYRSAAKNLGLPSLLRRQLGVRFGAKSYKLTSKYLTHPVFARRGTSDQRVFDQIFVEREYRCLDGVRDAHLILDCGANVGYSSAYLLSRFPESFIVAVEPDPANFSMLEENLHPYEHRFRAVHAAVWPRAAPLSLKKSSMGAGLEWGREVEEVREAPDGIEAVTIPMLMMMTEFKRISILKVDIEGSELALFGSGSIDWLDLVDNIVIELHGQKCSEAFFAAIDATRYDVSTCGELTVCRGGS